MLEHAYAPNAVAPPEIYTRYTWVQALHLDWADLGPPLSLEEIGVLAECLNLKAEADTVKARVGQGTRARG